MADVTIQYIWDYVANACGNEYGTAGLLGNIQAESGIIPFRLQGDFTSGYTKSITYTNNVDTGTYTENQFVHDSKGYGLAQWTYYSRKQNYYDWVQSRGGSIGSAENGVSFLVHELQTSYPSVWQTMVNATNIKTVSDKVLHEYENPAVQTESVENYRYNLSYNLYLTYGHGIPPVPPTPPPTPPTPTGDYSHILPIILGGEIDN